MGFWSLVLLAGFCFLGKATGKLKVKADPTLVKAAVGDDVLLECVFSFDGAPMDLSHLMIQWFRQGKQLAEFDNVVTVSRHGVNMSQEEVAKGNASLLLSRVGVENAGNYRCYITYSSEVHIREVTLQVVDPSQKSEEDLEDSFSSSLCLGRSEVMGKLAEITKALEQVEAKLQEFMSSKTAAGCSSDAVPLEPSC
ncbi:V-set domain-containing T-cell activation inhibitor 1-like isoform X1 [Elgaria multicarinata webbii]|uniref:V-set domain-containing T-cell activation inhibitor 1-like isoform X1 n=1 Tax=Elgaria multicarinata webbii TaxID=159646 RepID=UPI002FCCFB7E